MLFHAVTLIYQAILPRLVWLFPLLLHYPVLMDSKNIVCIIMVLLILYVTWASFFISFTSLPSSVISRSRWRQNLLMYCSRWLTTLSTELRRPCTAGLRVEKIAWSSGGTGTWYLSIRSYKSLVVSDSFSTLSTYNVKQ